MADDIYQIALRRLAALQDEKRELEAFIATYQKLATASPQAPEYTIVSKVTLVTGAPPRGSVTNTLVSAAMEIIADAKRAMKLGDIYTAILARGIIVGGKNPRNNLGAKLSADPRLKTIPGMGWWFASDPPPSGSSNGTTETRLGTEATYPRAGVVTYSENEEGPEGMPSEPSYQNGTTGVYPGDTATHAD